MKDEINRIICEETNALQELLTILEEQFGYIVKNEVFSLEVVVPKMEKKGREIAKWEVERRKLAQGESMNIIISSLKDAEIEKNFRNIKKLIEEVRIQKDTNQLLIKQRLSYTTNMLNILNPDRSPKTYGPYGKRR